MRAFHLRGSWLHAAGYCYCGALSPSLSQHNPPHICTKGNYTHNAPHNSQALFQLGGGIAHVQMDYAAVFSKYNMKIAVKCPSPQSFEALRLEVQSNQQPHRSPY
jgi:hypothetical protein